MGLTISSPPHQITLLLRLIYGPVACRNPLSQTRRKQLRSVRRLEVPTITIAIFWRRHLMRTLKSITRNMAALDRGKGPVQTTPSRMAAHVFSGSARRYPRGIFGRLLRHIATHRPQLGLEPSY